MTSFSLPNKPIQVRFVGGCKDGQILRSDSPNQNDASQASYFYFVSRGQIGSAFYVTSDAALEDLSKAKTTLNEDGTMTVEGLTVPPGPRHKYRLEECTDNESEVSLTFAFAGFRATPTPEAQPTPDSDPPDADRE